MASECRFWKYKLHCILQSLLSFDVDMYPQGMYFIAHLGTKEPAFWDRLNWWCLNKKCQPDRLGIVNIVKVSH